jgi:hypothetical protein
MLALAISCAMVGALLGLKFRVMVLVPTGAIILIALTVLELARGTALGTSALADGVAICATDLGYLGGATLRLLRRRYRRPR